MARVKRQPAAKTSSQLGQSTSPPQSLPAPPRAPSTRRASRFKRRCARTGQGKVLAGVEGPLGQQKKMKKQYSLPLLFRIGPDTKPVILFAPFARLVRGVAEFYSREVTRWTPEALLLLHYEAEFILMDKIFKKENPLTIHLGPVTIKQEQEEPSQVRSEDAHRDVAQQTVDKPAATLTRAARTRRRRVDAPMQVKAEAEEPSRRGRAVSKARKSVAMKAPAAASTKTAKRRRRGKGFCQRAKRARRQ